MATKFTTAYRRGYAVAPVVGDGVSAMSTQWQADLLAGHDPVVILEAASTVLYDIENERRSTLVARLPQPDQVSLAGWYRASRSMQAAPVPLDPLAALAATTLALGQSKPGERTDATREEIAGLLTQVGLRLNVTILEESSNSADPLLAMARTALWRAVVQEEWMIWSGELVHALAADADSAALTAEFESATGLSIVEWWSRGLGERSTRAVRGPGSWRNAERIDPDLEQAWIETFATPISDAIAKARGSLQQRKKGPPMVANPFDLSWLSSRPVVVTDDGRKFQLWIGANNRCLLPAGIAQALADHTGTRYDNVTERLGRVAEQLLTAHIDAMPEAADERRIPEAEVPAGQSTCDYVIEHDDVLVGVEFTIATPTRALGEGQPDAIDALIDRFASKIGQAYAVFRWLDPDHEKRWLPLLVLESPTVVDPLLNEQVHKKLIAGGTVEPDEPSELMTCHVPDFLDLVQYCSDEGVSLAQGVKAWRDSELAGAALDWWLSDHDARGTSGQRRIDAAFGNVEAILTRSS